MQVLDDPIHKHAPREQIPHSYLKDPRRRPKPNKKPHHLIQPCDIAYESRGIKVPTARLSEQIPPPY